MNSARTVLALGSSIVLESFTVDKVSPTSLLMIEGAVAGFGSGSGALASGWRYGTGAEVIAQSITYSGHNFAYTFPTRAIIAGHTTTGPQTLTFRFFSQNGAPNERPFTVYNPNFFDDGRLAQTQSVYVISEVEP